MIVADVGIVILYYNIYFGYNDVANYDNITIEVYLTLNNGCELKTTQRLHLHSTCLHVLLPRTHYLEDAGNALNSLPTNFDQISN